MILSVCGIDCTGCSYRAKDSCAGCREENGKVWWTQHIGAEVCPIYDCAVHRRDLNDCGSCPELPCQTWRDLKDPDHTDKVHEEGIRERVKNLTDRLNK
jgi:hypothetical protein